MLVGRCLYFGMNFQLLFIFVYANGDTLAIKSETA